MDSNREFFIYNCEHYSQFIIKHSSLNYAILRKVSLAKRNKKNSIKKNFIIVLLNTNR